MHFARISISIRVLSKSSRLPMIPLVVKEDAPTTMGSDLIFLNQLEADREMISPDRTVNNVMLL